MPLPEQHRPAALRALKQVFAGEEPDSITPLTGGLSGAGVYRVERQGRSCLLRIQPARDAIRDPARTHACMQIAAQAGVAPRVLFSSDEDGVSVTDFIQPGTPEEQPGKADPDRMAQLAGLLARLHAAPAFPPLIGYLDALEGLAGQVLSTALPTPDVAATIRETLGGLSRAYRPLPVDNVSSHNDVNPRNIVHDGVRPWLVDWEAAFLADRYVDLSAVANVFARTPETEAVFLTRYFGRAPTGAETARLFLARQISHLFHALAFLAGAAAEKPGQRLDGVAPDDRTLEQMHAALGAGAPLLDHWEGRLAYGLAHLGQARDAVRGPDVAKAARRAQEG